MIATAYSHADTQPTTPHPNRRMTNAERDAWIDEYRNLGGINSFELEVVYLLNEIRLERGLQPLGICPDLSMASRLMSQLMFEHHQGGRTYHQDPFYGSPWDRTLFFNPAITAIENLSWQSTPSSVIESFMNSPGHRNSMLSSSRSYIGIGFLPRSAAIMKLD